MLVVSFIFIVISRYYTYYESRKEMSERKSIAVYAGSKLEGDSAPKRESVRMSHAERRKSKKNADQ
jgi:hypothetical protein